jgi:hypothetical protein
MSKLLAFGAALAGLMAVPAIALLALIGLTGRAVACGQLPNGELAPTAPVPAQARLWIAMAHAACPPLPEPWIAAVMAQESGFRPDAYADDGNGGTWGLFQINASIWQATYGAPWQVDLNANGVWDVKDPEIHAATGGKYLCHRLDDVRRIRTAHPDWASTRDLTELDALGVAHNAGESRLASYPLIPVVTNQFVRAVRSRAEEWSTSTASVAGDAASSLATTDESCQESVAAVGSVVVPPGTPVDVATAVRASLDLIGVRSGWSRQCDRLACHAYGFANSGYVSASAHWASMLATGHGHTGDHCPPVGSFMFWSTPGPDGHVALIVQSDAACDPDRIELVSNDVLDRRTGYDGGVYLVTLTQIESGFVSRAGYLGWSNPVCAGLALPAATRRPAT